MAFHGVNDKIGCVGFPVNKKTNVRSFFIDKYQPCPYVRTVGEESMSTLYFIRHGQASFGKEDYDELSETGHRQARILAHFFEVTGRRFDAIYTGTLSRHLRTAEAMLTLLNDVKAPIPPVRQLEGLNEYPTHDIFPALAPAAVAADPSLATDVAALMKDRKAFQRVFEAVMGIWASGKHDIPGLLTWQEFKGKVNRAIDEIMKNDGTGKNVAVFTSGGTISVAVQRTLGLGDAGAMKIAEQLVNTSVTRFKCTRDRIMMATFNEHAHLERENDERLITYR
jgi:broad specificity phosphatase PhoE